MQELPDHWREALLEEEGLTDGLTDAAAQILLDGALQRTAALVTARLPLAERESRFHLLRQQIRGVSHIVLACQEGASSDQLQQLLNRLWPDPHQQAALLSQLQGEDPPEAQIRCLLAALEEPAICEGGEA